MGLIFVTGSGTEVGKTYAAAALVRARRAAGRTVVALKPVASGVGPVSAADFARSDTAVLLAAQGLPVDPHTVAACTPWRYAAPLSPDMAARAEGRTLTLAEVTAWCRQRLAETPTDADILIEGVGGVMSPATEDATNLDWIAALGCPAVLVCGTYLGAVSHALTAAACLRADAGALAATILNESPQPSVGLVPTAAALRRFGRLQPIPLHRDGALPASAWPGASSGFDVA